MISNLITNLLNLASVMKFGFTIYNVKGHEIFEKASYPLVKLQLQRSPENLKKRHMF